MSLAPAPELFSFTPSVLDVGEEEEVSSSSTDEQNIWGKWPGRVVLLLPQVSSLSLLDFLLLSFFLFLALPGRSARVNIERGGKNHFSAPLSPHGRILGLLPYRGSCFLPYVRLTLFIYPNTQETFLGYHFFRPKRGSYRKRKKEKKTARIRSFEMDYSKKGDSCVCVWDFVFSLVLFLLLLYPR